MKKSLPSMLVGLALGLMPTAVAASAHVHAQAAAGNGYDVIETEAKFQPAKVQKSLRSSVGRIIRQGASLQGKDQIRFDTYFEKMLFAGWTQPEKLRKIVAQRQDFFKREYKSAGGSSPAIFKHLNELTLKNMIAIAGGNYHPAARHNAMLVLGRLKAAGGDGAKPYAQALTATGGLIDSAKSPNQHPAVRIAAMVGLIFHAKSGVAGATQNQMVNTVRGILQEDQPAGQMSADGHRWLRIRAAEIASLIGDPGPNNVIAAKLAALVGDEKESLSLRCAAARSLGILKVANNTNLKSEEIAGALGNLALDTLSAGLASDQPNARRLYHRTQSAAIGFRIAKEPATDDIKKEVTAAAALFADNSSDAEAMGQAAKKIRAALEKHNLLRSAPKGAAPADAEPNNKNR